MESELKKELKRLKADPETKQVGCGCISLLATLPIIAVLINAEESGGLDFWTTCLVVVAIVAVFIVGTIFSGGFN